MCNHLNPKIYKEGLTDMIALNRENANEYSLILACPDITRLEIVKKEIDRKNGNKKNLEAE